MREALFCIQVRQVFGKWCNLYLKSVISGFDRPSSIKILHGSGKLEFQLLINAKLFFYDVVALICRRIFVMHSYLRWKYAYNCILEEDVRRKKRMWSWTHMARHREMKKIYKEAYRKKLESNKKQSEVVKVIEVL